MTGHPQFIFSAIMISVAALVACLFFFIPSWSRRGIFFAVTVVPDFRHSPKAHRIVRNYRALVLLTLGIGYALIFLGAREERFLLLMIGTLFVLIGPLSATARAHGQALPHAIAVSTIREASLAPRRTRLPGGWILQLGPFVILLATAAYLAAHWDRIPDRFPVHWGIDGLPNGWSTRTPLGVYGPLCFGAALVVLISLVAYAVSHSARHVPAVDGVPGTSDFPHRIAIVLLGVEYFLASMFSLVGFLPLTGSPGALTILILAVVIIVAVIFLGGWLSHRRASFDHIPGDGTPDSSWKLGLFYYNPDDAALFVEKRVGIGYTINYARPSAWIITAFFVLLPLTLAAIALANH
jgi:uncharacterized membrane protein